MTDRKYTYAELRDHSAAFAVRLQMQFHMKQNDVVAVCLPNIPEFPIATLGAAEAGLVVTTVNPIYTPGKNYLVAVTMAVNIIVFKHAVMQVMYANTTSCCKSRYCFN